jgi:biotin transport system substrate-specific component
MTSLALGTRPVIVDRVVPRFLARDAVLVLGAALLTAAMAQLSVPVPGSPVPITGQTFAVLLTAAALGPLRGTAGQATYVLLGMVGLPFYSDGQGGLDAAFGATAGYLLGFVVAAFLVGTLARRGLDRHPLGVLVAFAVGTVAIYGLGVPWLAYSVDVSLAEAVEIGLTPFLVGAALKAFLAAGLLPAAWRLVGDR